MKWPKHKASMHITHNEHLTNYQTVEEYSESGYAPHWVSEEEKKQAIATNSVWEFQWYPETPIGSYAIAASTFELAHKAALSIDKENDK